MTRRIFRLPDDRFLWIGLVFAFVLRLTVILVFFADQVRLHGADSQFYVLVARHADRLWFGHHSLAPVTSIGPGYPLYLLPFYALPMSLDASLLAVRIGHAVLDTLTVFIVYHIALTLFNHRVARVALVAQALDPRYLFQNGAVATETLFITFFALFVWLYVRAVRDTSWHMFRLAGVVLGLSILIRPLPILLPVALAAALFLTDRVRRHLWMGYLWMVITTLLVLTPWQIRTVIVTGDLIPISTTATTHLWLSTYGEGRDLSSEDFSDIKRDAFGVNEEGNTDVTESKVVSIAASNILKAPLSWVSRILVDTFKTHLQPYGTILLVPADAPPVGETLRSVFNGETSFLTLITIPGLWRRLLMYIWHFWGLLFGLIGIFFIWREGLLSRALPLITWIVYGTAVSAVLLIEPRYLFPMMFAYTILAAFATIHLWDRLSLPRPRWLSRHPSLETA